jgi:hypothetical protein
MIYSIAGERQTGLKVFGDEIGHFGKQLLR